MSERDASHVGAAGWTEVELGWAGEWSRDEIEEETALEPPSLWEAEMVALGDEQLLAMQDAAEDE